MELPLVCMGGTGASQGYMTAESTIDYEGLTQEAMRGVVRTVLARTAKDGLAGDHHFYISFDTEADGVVLSRRLKEKYPKEMTIVLQHRFWSLLVSDDQFEVKLTFDGIPERLVVPFDAVKVFFDPSVRFGLQFEAGGASMDGVDGDASFDAMKPRNTSQPVAGRISRAPRRASLSNGMDDAETGTVFAGPGSDRNPDLVANGDGDDRLEVAEAETSLGDDEAQTSSDAEATEATEADVDTDADAADENAVPSGGAEIVSLDQFRKK